MLKATLKLCVHLWVTKCLNWSDSELVGGREDIRSNTQTLNHVSGTRIKHTLVDGARTGGLLSKVPEICTCVLFSEEVDVQLDQSTPAK